MDRLSRTLRSSMSTVPYRVTKYVRLWMPPSTARVPSQRPGHLIASQCSARTADNLHCVVGPKFAASLGLPRRTARASELNCRRIRRGYRPSQRRFPPSSRQRVGPPSNTLRCTGAPLLRAFVGVQIFRCRLAINTGLHRGVPYHATVLSVICHKFEESAHISDPPGQSRRPPHNHITAVATFIPLQAVARLSDRRLTDRGGNA
jgi:hypothetical protein